MSCIAIPCNTAHFWYDQLSASASVPIFHIADAACDCVAPHTPAGGLLHRNSGRRPAPELARVYQAAHRTRRGSGALSRHRAMWMISSCRDPSNQGRRHGGRQSASSRAGANAIGREGEPTNYIRAHGNPDRFASRDSSRFDLSMRQKRLRIDALAGGVANVQICAVSERSWPRTPIDAPLTHRQSRGA